jgi:hypothetical protein
MRLAAMLSIVIPAALAAAAAVAAERPASATAMDDPQLKRQFDELKYEYEVDEDGDYKLVFSVDDKDKRSQLVFVRSPVETYGKHRVREVWSPGYKSPTPEIPATVANRLLEASDDNKLGAWVKQNDYAVFVVKISADASTEELENAITAAMISADEMEAELSPGKDDL